MTYSLTSTTSPSLFQGFSGSIIPTRKNTNVHITRTANPAYPPNKFRTTEYANREDENAGPVAREMDTVVCAKPFIVPRERLFGAEEVTKINTQPIFLIQKLKLK